MGSSPQDVAARWNIIDITDLHHPVLTEVQKQVMAGAEAAADQIVFQPAFILGAAQAQTVPLPPQPSVPRRRARETRCSAGLRGSWRPRSAPPPRSWTAWRLTRTTRR